MPLLDGIQFMLKKFVGAFAPNVLPAASRLRTAKATIFGRCSRAVKRRWLVDKDLVFMMTFRCGIKVSRPTAWEEMPCGKSGGGMRLQKSRPAENGPASSSPMPASGSWLVKGTTGKRSLLSPPRPPAGFPRYPKQTRTPNQCRGKLTVNLINGRSSFFVRLQLGSH